MATGKMDLSTFVGKLLEEQDGDVLREGIRVLSQALMESEVAGLIGADRYERTSDRQTYRNGYRLRTWDTRVGTIELAIPKLRAGSYFPSLLEPPPNDRSNNAPAKEARVIRGRNEVMAKREKLPPGLYRRRKRDGTPGDVLWCWFRPKGRRQPVKMSTGTSDVEQAQRFLYAKLAEDPNVRAERITTAAVTVSDALFLLRGDREKRGTATENAVYYGLRHALGPLAISAPRPIHLDALCDRWRKAGIDYPERHRRRNPQHPVSGTTCNHGMRMPRQPLRLAAVKLAVPLPPGMGDPLAYPKFKEPVTGSYIPPGDFYRILEHVEAGAKAMLCELAYLTGVRKGQLRKTELHNVRVQHGKVVALVWDASKVKNRREHVIPLEERAQAIVQELWKVRRPGCPLFHIEGRPIGQLRTEWGRACRVAGFPVGRKTGGLVFHDTRRSAVTNLAAAHVPDVVARSISGHRTPAVHARYNITPEGAKRAALAAADRLVKAGRNG